MVDSSVITNGTRIREKVDYSQRKVALVGDFVTFFFECLNIFL